MLTTLMTYARGSRAHAPASGRFHTTIREGCCFRCEITGLVFPFSIDVSQRRTAFVSCEYWGRFFPDFRSPDDIVSVRSCGGTREDSATLPVWKVVGLWFRLFSMPQFLAPL